MPKQNTTDNLQQAMMQPKRVEVDGKTVEQHNLSDMIAMDKYVESKKALKRRGLGIRFTKMESGGGAR